MEWISVEERLPEKGRYHIMVWSQKSKVAAIILVATLLVNVKWNSTGRNYTHWMPLPPAPEEVKP